MSLKSRYSGMHPNDIYFDLESQHLLTNIERGQGKTMTAMFQFFTHLSEMLDQGTLLRFDGSVSPEQLSELRRRMANDKQGREQDRGNFNGVLQAACAHFTPTDPSIHRSPGLFGVYMDEGYCNW